MFFTRAISKVKMQTFILVTDYNLIEYNLNESTAC